MTKMMNTKSGKNQQSERATYHSVEVIQPLGDSPEHGRLRAMLNLSALPQVSEGYDKPSISLTAIPESEGNVGIPELGFLVRLCVLTTHLGADAMTIHMTSLDAEKLHTFGLDYVVYADITTPRNDELASSLTPGSIVFMTVDVKQPEPLKKEVLEEITETDHLDTSIIPE